MPPDRPLSAQLAPYLALCRFAEPGTPVVCAVSGGADSLALLVLAVSAQLNVEAVHVDHGLRPASAQEADVVRSAAELLGATFRAETVVVEPGGDLESRARAARHAALGPHALTGHTADDQAETVLINLMRGAGAHGLAAMQPGGTHPILALRRSETEHVCELIGLDVVSDPSNDDRRFVRNRVRHELLPLMTEISGRDVIPLLNRTADQARALAAWVDESAQGLDPTDSSALVAAPATVAAAALRRWLHNGEHPPSSAEIDRVMAVARHEAVGCEVSGGRRVRRTARRLRIEPRDSDLGLGSPPNDS